MESFAFFVGKKRGKKWMTDEKKWWHYFSHFTLEYYDSIYTYPLLCLCNRCFVGLLCTDDTNLRSHNNSEIVKRWNMNLSRAKWGPVHAYSDIFESATFSFRRRLYRPHAYGELASKSGNFWIRSPEWTFLNPIKFRIRVEGRIRIFCDTMTSLN